jgi:hypothetical protein
MVRRLHRLLYLLVDFAGNLLSGHIWPRTYYKPENVRSQLVFSVAYFFVFPAYFPLIFRCWAIVRHQAALPENILVYYDSLLAYLLFIFHKKQRK